MLIVNGSDIHETWNESQIYRSRDPFHEQKLCQEPWNPINDRWSLRRKCNDQKGNIPLACWFYVHRRPQWTYEGLYLKDW